MRHPINATTAATLWQFFTGCNVVTTAAVANGLLYVGSDDMHVYAFDSLRASEPGALALLGLSLAGPAASRRRKQQSATLHDNSASSGLAVCTTRPAQRVRPN
ncbi:MAG: PQQ-binding-like beta-propeller repeat protein [Gemmatimonadota bacterium]